MDNMTAKVSCFARAYHCRNNETRIFADTMAEKLLGADYETVAQSMAQGVGFFLPGFQGTAQEGLRLIVDRQLSPSVLGRSAFCEAMLKNEREKGCAQYALFAAGYDTFALRDTDEKLTVYELDLPGLIADKAERIRRGGLRSRAVYVPCDLARDDWPQKLTAAGFRAEDKSFCSLLGISYYLTKEEFALLLKRAAGVLAKGSALCFDYPSVDESRETKVNRALAGGAGEAMKALYATDEMTALLKDCGFTVSAHLGSADMTDRYFSAYNAAAPEHPMAAPDGVAYIAAARE